MADTTIKVPTEVRDRLAVLAASRSTTIGRLVADLAETTLTDEERAERAEATRRIVREQTGHTVTADDQAKVNALIKQALTRVEQQGAADAA
jgi:hypothetical protein